MALVYVRDFDNKYHRFSALELKMELKKLIKKQDYEKIAKSTWPIYQDLINGHAAKSLQEQQDIDNFVFERYQDYYQNDRGNEIADGNRTWQAQTFFNKNTQIPTHKMCRVPWETLGVNSYGDIFICQSPAWIPKFAGNIHHADDIYDVLNSDIAVKIRAEISAGRYFYCNQRLCSFFHNQPIDVYQNSAQTSEDLQPMIVDRSENLLVHQIPKYLIFDFDHTCNFKCPSCRTQLVNNNKHRIVRSINNLILERIKTLIIDKIQDQPILIRWAGGEPFISDVYSDLLEYIINTGKTNIRHIIQTNGSYLRNKSHIVEKLLPYLAELRISFDAATAETYHEIRVNGVWENLLENVRWTIDEIQRSGLSVEVTADFVVQKGNYQEIPLFADLCKGLGIKNINYQKMWDWYTWPKEEFNQHNVWSPDHPEYDTVLDLLDQVKNRPEFKNKRTSWGRVS